MSLKTKVVPGFVHKTTARLTARTLLAGLAAWTFFLPFPEGLLLPAGGLSARPEGLIVVPTAGREAVVLDGFLSPDEWEDALLLANGEMTIYLKGSREEIFIGVTCPSRPRTGADLFLSAEGADIHQLRVSAGFLERQFAPSDLRGLVPETAWTAPADWSAGSSAADRPEAGVEFKIDKDKLPGRLWKMRLELDPRVRDRERLVFPRETGIVTTYRWLSLLIT